MKATIYEHSTGRILRTIQAGRESDLLLNIGEGDYWLEGEYSSNEYYVKNGEATILPEKPDYPCEFDFAIEEWVWDEVQSWRVLREERDRLLSATDWTQVPDAPVDQQAWAIYRQELRDLPDNTTDPRNPVWPTRPS